MNTLFGENCSTQTVVSLMVDNSNNAYKASKASVSSKSDIVTKVINYISEL